MKAFGLAQIQSGDLAGYTSTYIDSMYELSDFVKNLDGVKTALRTSDLAEAHDLVRASAVLSDLTTLTLAGGTSMQATVRWGGPEKVPLPMAYLKKYNIDPADPTMRVMVVLPDEEPYRNFIRDCSPLVEQGRLLVRPTRIVMFQVAEHQWQGLPADAEDRDDSWIVSGEAQALGEIPVQVENDSSIPFDITLPYLRGVPFAVLTKILEEANDTVLNLRRALRDALSKLPVQDAKARAEFTRDVIDPELEGLQRTFKKAEQSALRAAGTVTLGAVGLSLSAILTRSTPGPVISGLLGTGGAGLVAKEYFAFQAKLQEMKDHPYYLFWRAKYRWPR